MTASARYRRRLNAERDAAAVYRALASRKSGDEQAVLLALANAEERHAGHWAELLEGDEQPHQLGLRARILSWLALRVGSLLVLALVERAETGEDYSTDAEATAAMAADERVHARVVSVLAQQRRARASGLLRAGVFGVNDGLVSNLSLVLGVVGAGVAGNTVLVTGLAGLLAGALSMAAGEYVSVRAQRELLSVTPPALDEAALTALRGAETHELALAYRAQGMSEEAAEVRAAQLLAGTEPDPDTDPLLTMPQDIAGSAWGAAAVSFVAFSAGALMPVLPFFYARGTGAIVVAAGLTGVVLFVAGAAAAVLAGGRLLVGGLRQFGIGMTAAAATFALGSLFGVTLG